MVKRKPKLTIAERNKRISEGLKLAWARIKLEENGTACATKLRGTEK